MSPIQWMDFTTHSTLLPKVGNSERPSVPSEGSKPHSSKSFGGTSLRSPRRKSTAS